MAEKKIVKSRFFAVYNKDGKTNLTKFRGLSGVYIIRRENNPELVYIGYSGVNLYKTVLRHFQSWQDKTQVRATFPKYGYSVRIILCSPERSALLEAALIKKHSPPGNPMQLKGIRTVKEWAILEEYEAVPATNYDDIKTPF
jgi:excinuclease UvrABC nuclease subunit